MTTTIQPPPPRATQPETGHREFYIRVKFPDSIPAPVRAEAEQYATERADIKVTSNIPGLKLDNAIPNTYSFSRLEVKRCVETSGRNDVVGGKLVHTRMNPVESYEVSLPYFRASAPTLAEVTVKTEEFIQQNISKNETILWKCAVAAGVQNKSYDTVRYGLVEDFRGTAEFSLNGRRYRATGYGPSGDAQCLTGRGGIRFEILG